VPTFKIFDAIRFARVFASELAVPFNAEPVAFGSGDSTDVPDGAEITAERESFADIKVGHVDRYQVSRGESQLKFCIIQGLERGLVRKACLLKTESRKLMITEY
jgi:hypothetical protein